MKDKNTGMYRKYEVKRLNDETGKLKDCEFFVLDLDYDKFAVPALKAYAEACKKEYPKLAADIESKLYVIENIEFLKLWTNGTDWVITESAEKALEITVEDYMTTAEDVDEYYEETRWPHKVHWEDAPKGQDLVEYADVRAILKDFQPNQVIFSTEW